MPRASYNYVMKIYDGKNFFIYGDGTSGRAALRAIKKHGGKAKIYSDKNGVFVKPKDGVYDGAVISPGIRRDHAVYDYALANKIPTTGEVEIGFAIADCPVIGVTGTNGKTTVTSLIAAMLGGTACGNIGYPITTAAEREKKVLVCELSSFQLYDAVIYPKAAVITNIEADHIDWHGSFEEYCRCKCNIASNMDGDGVLVLGEDVKVGALKTLKTEARIIRCSSVGAVDGAYIEDGFFKFFGERVCSTDYLRLGGAHNLKNALTAVAVAKSMGADNRDIIKALSTAKLDAHRVEYVGTACGKKWIDDSKATNIAACLAAVETTHDSVCLIVGGRNKGLDFEPLFRELPERVIDVIAMGECGEDVSEAAERAKFSGSVIIADRLSAAVSAATKSAAQTVLLSPCCASFDEFGNYAERGDSFKAEVNALRGRK